MATTITLELYNTSMNPDQNQSGQQPQYQPPNNSDNPPGQQPQPWQPQSPMYTEPVPGTQPQVVYMARPLEPAKQEMSLEVQQKHEDSKRLYPKLNLSQGEYVVSVVKRNPIGLVSIWGSTAAIIIVLFVIVAIVASASKSSSSTLNASNLSPAVLLIPAALISLLALLFGFVASSVYRANEFILTNESIIQHIQTSLFNMREQTISLQGIEDASYSQDGIMPHMFNYGSIRLSTIGDEDTYRFHYTSNPHSQIATLNNAVEAFKNGRRVED